MPKVSDAHRDRMRIRLLTAAATVFEQHGFVNTTVREIVAEAGVSPKTLYAYFDGKDSLLEALVGELVAAGMREFEERERTDSDEELADWLMEALSRPPSRAGSLLAGLRTRTDSEAGERLLPRTNALVVETLRPAVTRLAQTGALQIEDVDAFLELMDITADGMVRRADTNSFVTSWDRVARARLALLEQIRRASDE